MQNSCPKCKSETIAEANFCHICAQMLRPFCVVCRISLPNKSNFCFKCSLPVSSAGVSVAYAAPQTPTNEGSSSASPDIKSAINEVIPAELASKYKSAQVAITSERKLVSIVFADLSGFTPLSEKLGPERITEIINQCFKRLGRIVYEFEGYIDKFMGDCIMALFGAPIAHENDPELAINCALKMLEELKAINEELDLDLELSIGINSGMVVAGSVGTDQKFEYTVMGDAVNVAQRLQSAAESQQILVTKNIHKLCEHKFDFEILPPVKVKGKDVPIEVFAVNGSKKNVELKDRGVQSGYSKLIGRENEAKKIEGLLEKAREGQGQILVIAGEPGVGKSRLKHEAKKISQAKGFRWFESKCTNLNRETPYFAFMGLIQEMLEIDPKSEIAAQKEQMKKLSVSMLEKTSQILLYDLLKIPTEEAPISLAGTQKKKAVFVAITDFIFQSLKNSPTMIYLEDLHWMDPISRELLNHLFEFVPESSLVLAAGSRPDFVHGWNQIRNFSEISLSPLTAGQSLDLVKAILNLPEIPRGLEKLIQTKTDGNPLYVEEIVKSLIDSGKIFKTSSGWTVSADVQDVEIPHTLQGIIASRIDRLSDGEKLVLQYAAIIGRRFSDALLVKAMGDATNLYESLKNLRKKELLFEISSETDEIVYMFNHALVQEVAYQSILVKTRKLIHQKVAQALEDIYHTESENISTEYLEALAHHYVEAEVKEKAVEYLFRSGRRLMDDYNNEGAIKAYQKAIKIAAHSSNKLSSIYDCLSEIYMRVGDFDAAEKYQIRLLEIGKSKNDPLHIASACRRIGQICLNRGHFDKALENLHRSLDWSIKGADFEGQIRTYKVLANTWKKLNNFPKALEMFDMGIQGARTLGNKRLIAEYLNDKATVQIELHQIEEARDNLEKSIEISQTSAAFKTLLVTSTLNLGVVQYFKKDFKGALAKFRETELVAHQIGDLMNELIAKHNVGEMLSEFQQYEEALKEFEESFKIAKNIGNELERVNNHLLIGHTKVKLGDLENGRKIIDEALEEAKSRKFWNYYLNGLFCLKDYFSAAGNFKEASATIELAAEKAKELSNQSVLARCEEERLKLKSHTEDKKVVRLKSKKQESS